MTNTRPTAAGVLRYPASIDEGALNDMRTALLTCAELEGVSLEQVLEIDESRQRPTGMQTEDCDQIQSLLENSEAVTLLVIGDLDASIVDLVRRRELRVITTPLPGEQLTDAEATSASNGTRLVEVDLLNGRQWRVGTLAIAVTGRVVSMRYDGVPIAALDRDRFRGWLHDSRDVLAVGDLAWSSEAGTVQVSVKKSMPYSIPAVAISELLAVM